MPKLSKKERDTHFSNRTGTKKREKKIKNKKKYKEEIKVKVKLNEKRRELKKGNNSNNRYILNAINDEVIMEINGESIDNQHKSIMTLSLCLNRMGLPSDISRIIFGYAMNNVYIEPCIFKIMPDDMLKVISNKESTKQELNDVLINYIGKSKLIDYIKKCYDILHISYYNRQYLLF